MCADNRHKIFGGSRGRGKIVLYVVSLLVVIGFMAMLRQCSTPAPFAAARIGNSGGDTLDVAIEYGPMTLYRYDDTLGGFAYDALRIMSAENGVPVKFHPVTSGRQASRLLADGLVDLVVADTPMTADYDSSFAFTTPVYLDRQVLVQRVDSDGVAVTSALELAGKRVTVTADSPMLHRLRNISAEIGDTIIIEVDSIHGAEQLVMMTALGDIDMTVVNKRLAESMSANYPSLDAGTRISFTQFQSWILRSSDSILRSRLDTMIVRFKAEEEYNRLVGRYGMQ